ncbi:MAG: hypothetical protein K9N21_18590 [Deltaproteobacteria bacterium]|nr:hypothetical protein [Deltaproteobacteria bacterium]
MKALIRTVIIFVPIGLVLLPVGLAHPQENDEAVPLTFELSPTLQYRSVDGDENKFREDQWIQEGWAEGVENFLLEKSIRGGWMLHMEGRAIVPEEDYRFLLDLGKKDLGFFHAHFTQYRKYFDDTGGYFRPFAIPVFHLDKDMHLDIGSFSLEAGITIPDLPKIVIGYERKFKEGEKSLLEWGSVTEGAVTRKIFPSFQEIDEQVDIFKVDVAHHIGKVHLEDRFRYEKYKTDTTRFEQDRNLDAGTSETVNVSERYDHDALYNTFHLDSQISETIYFSFGYLLNDVDGDASFNMLTTPFGPDPFDKNWRTNSIILDQKSHVLNLNARFGPYRQLSFHGGIQAEITNTEGDSDAILTETLPGQGPVSPEARSQSRTDKKGFMETVGVRYSGIPHTSLYAEGKWTQQGIDLYEKEVEDAVTVFERLTDTDVDRSRYTFGFSSSPIRRLTLSGRYRRRCHDNDYDHKIDTDPGYSAFINSQELDTEEIQAKVTARLTGTFKTSFQYQRVKTEIDTLSQTTPPSNVESGDYVADIYSLNVTSTPIASLYLTGQFSYRDVNSESFANGSPTVTGYDGDVYTFIGTAGWAVGKKTDLTLQYLLSWSDNFQDNSAVGLPLGLDNTRHGLSLSCTHKLNDTIRARFGYGFYKYDEESNGGSDDYTAHVLGVGLEIIF